MTETILIVDDSGAARRDAQLALERSGYTTICANDGLEGLKQLRQHSAIRVVICDLHMPRMDGLDFVKIALRPAAYPDLQVVMLTTTGSGVAVKEAVGAGIAAWLVKPFQSDMLVATVSKVLSKTAPAGTPSARAARTG